MTSKEIKEEKEACISDLISNYEFEIAQMKSILALINSEKWNEVDFCLNLKNPEDWKNIISKFDFKDCVQVKYIIAIKKLVKMAFEDGIKDKETALKEIKKFNFVH